MWMHTRAGAGKARNPAMTAISSIRLFVVSKAPPERSHGSALLPSERRKTSTAAYPPARLVLLAQAPSVQMSYVRSLGEATMPAVCRTRSTARSQRGALDRLPLFLETPRKRRNAANAGTTRLAGVSRVNERDRGVWPRVAT